MSEGWGCGLGKHAIFRGLEAIRACIFSVGMLPGEVWCARQQWRVQRTLDGRSLAVCRGRAA